MRVESQMAKVDPIRMPWVSRPYRGAYPPVQELKA